MAGHAAELAPLLDDVTLVARRLAQARPSLMKARVSSSK